ncbi:hypothetical protein J3E64_001726 [Sphingobium sp. OAS761]|nr:hypothetical protein [Sphingobium sp. OAS761]
MRPVEKFVGGQKGIVQPRAMILINLATSEFMIQTGLKAPAHQWLCIAQMIGDTSFNEIGKGCLVGTDETARLVQRGRQLRRYVWHGACQRQDLAPAVRCGLIFLHPLLELRHAYLRHQVPLVYRDSAIQSGAFPIRIHEPAFGRREVHPKGRFAGINLRGSRKMHPCRGKIALLQRDQAQQVQRLRLGWMSRKYALQYFFRFGRSAGSSGFHRLLQ